jgi:hypothetical protein
MKVALERGKKGAASDRPAHGGNGREGSQEQEGCAPDLILSRLLLAKNQEFYLGDFIEDKTVVSPWDAVLSLDLKEKTASLLKALPSREETIIRMRFGLDDGNEHTLEEVEPGVRRYSRAHSSD